MGRECLHGCKQTFTEPLLCNLKITMRKKKRDGELNKLKKKKEEEGERNKPQRGKLNSFQ